ATWIVVTNPNGGQAYRRVEPFNPAEIRREKGQLGIFWPVLGDTGWPSSGVPSHTCDPYSPIRVYTDDGRVYQWHRPYFNCQYTASNWVSWDDGGQHKVYVTAPMTLPTEYSTARSLTRSTPAPADTWQWERHVLDVTSADYYTYCWDITNGG